MRRGELQQLLDALVAGELSSDEVARRLESSLELGFAKLDLARERRTGTPEVVFAQGKRLDDLERIVARLLEHEGRVLVTRVSAEAARELSERHPEGIYEERARVWSVGSRSGDGSRRVAVLAAGTADLPVAEEAATCAAWLGLDVSTHFDVGVAGLHRLVGVLPELEPVGVVIAVAGMDGALPTVLAGLVRQPVVAVPTSVGYGVAFEGLAPLLTMLNGCAPGSAVVNIDNGFGAAAFASRILETKDRCAD